MSLVPYLLLALAAIAVLQTFLRLTESKVETTTDKYVAVKKELEEKLRRQGVQNYKAMADVQFSSMLDRATFIDYAQKEYLKTGKDLEEIKKLFLEASGPLFAVVTERTYGKAIGALHTRMSSDEIRSLQPWDVFTTPETREKYDKHVKAALDNAAAFHTNNKPEPNPVMDRLVEDLYAGRGRL